jgi:tetratricopeptide (TPR) repeat protein
MENTILKSEKFFRKSDWIACLVCFFVSLTVYVLTLQPTVGLEDSGELIVASDYLGVPHPPGYPIWSLLTWFFQWVFHSVTFHGHPNPAWAVNLFSAVAGAAACGVLALLISRSGMDLLRSMKKESNMLGEKTESLFCAAAGISGGLLLAFGQGMWSQAVIAEVYSFNIFFQSLVLLFLYRWMVEPKDSKWLLLCAFAFGLGITNHQTLMFMGLAMAIAILFRDLRLFRDFAIVGFILLLLIGSTKAIGMHAEDLAEKIQLMTSAAARTKAAIVQQGLLNSLWGKGWHYSGFWLFLIGIVSTPILLAVNPKPRTIMIITACFALLFVGTDLQAKHQTKKHEKLIQKAKATALTLEEHKELEGTRNGNTLRIYQQDVVVNGKTHALKGFNNPVFTTAFLYLAIIPGLLLLRLPNGKVVGATFLVMFIGLAFYLYMPFSSDQNPPINWGYPRTWQGFLHAITRGHYERVKLAHVFPPRFLQQVGTYIMDLRSQFYWPIALLAGVPFIFCGKVGKRNLAWLATTLVAFLSVGIVFMILQNPKTDVQSLFIGRVQYIQSHAIYVIWMGYGILLLMAWFESLVKNNPVTKVVGVACVLLLPFALIHKNYHNADQVKIVGGAEQNGHDFGWQFGNWQLQGVDGIKEDMQAWYSPEEFEKRWAAYPNKNYPEPMGPNAVFFGGTDPGRFVPTYMIYSAKVRQDVYLITQNALADNTYMNVMRDLYGDQIWIPSPLDSNMAFQKFLETEKNTAGVSTAGGKVQVQGVQHVMKINGFLSQWIFEHNQYRTETKTDEATRPTGSVVVHNDPAIDPQTGKPPLRTFYVEESYVLPWMYPYLTPNGLIMKINNKPTALTPEVVKNDTDFWNWNCDRLLGDEKFIRDIVARKTFSKLRSALAGLYAMKGKPKEAEAAFRQSVALYDLSPEANFRLANLIARQGRFDEAIALFDDLLAKDPNNEKARNFQNNLRKMKTLGGQRQLLEQKLKSGNIEFADAMQLVSIYFQSGQASHADALAKQMLNSNTMQPQMILNLAQHMAKGRRYAVVEQALKKYTTVQPKDPKGWLNLAALQLVLKKQGEMWVSIDQAIKVGGEPTRNIIRKDTRFNAIRNTKEFQERFPPMQGLSPLPGF